MSLDISSEYTKERNQKCGRKGYGMWKHEKDTVISPKDYGSFVEKKKKSKGRKRI